MTVVMLAKSDAGRYENKPVGQDYGNIVFDLSENGEGYVLNGAWYFEVLEFRLPYMKIKVLHPRKPFEVECHNVVKI